MQLHKIPHPDNFDFVRQVSGRSGAREARTQHEQLTCHIESLGEDVFRLTLDARRWKKRQCLHPLNTDFGPPGAYRLQLSKDGGLSLAPRGKRGSTDERGPADKRGPFGKDVSLRGEAKQTLGLNAAAWVMRLLPQKGDRFFGMGEKWGPLEKSGGRFQFWNTDLWADFPSENIDRADVDATYASIPYLIVERSGVFFGILLDTPYRAFMATGPRLSLFEEGAFESTHPDDEHQGEGTKGSPQFHVGATDGKPIVYFLVGPSLRELTCKLQRLVGTTPRPPLWALGHHQSRWGYGTSEDLRGLDEKFQEHSIPNDGLWLDIDYMDEYRVFTIKQGSLPKEALQRLRARRRRIVPILDPGVKSEKGYFVFDEGLAHQHFCLAPSGRPYTGIVWPGRTHFPDFSQKATRAWWAEHVSQFAQVGFDGFWIDMNDPSTGPIESESMLFSGGRSSHASFHNQYGLAMASATKHGLVAAAPEKRPFVLTRSASTGIASYAAMWTGDNISSFRHLERSIPISINLALSGVPFNGPDVPGFGGDANEQLAERFYQATCLFPFLRNHSVQGSRHQEPWSFAPETLESIRRFIRLRYRLLPYLYQAFVAQERSGSPILGPLFLDGASERPLREDQFMVGSELLVAPVVTPQSRRSIWLPRGHWYCLRTGTWLEGGREIQLTVPRGELPLYVRSGAVLPLCTERAVDPDDGGAPHAAQILGDLELHVFLRPGERGELLYTVDDGETVRYRQGEEAVVRFAARRARPRTSARSANDSSARERIELRCEVVKGAEHASRLNYRVVVHGLSQEGSGAKAHPRVQVAGTEIELRPGKLRFSGKSLKAWQTDAAHPIAVT